MSAGNRGTKTVTFSAFDTPVVAQPVVLLNLVGLWTLLTWLTGRRAPECPWCVRLLVGFLGMAALMAADLGHALAHIVSARWAGAPTDEVQVSAGMPRTIYTNNDVVPRAHRLRALGGPLFSAAGLLLSLIWRSAVSPGSVQRELADWSCLGHGLILGGSLTPLPIVDGGVILKWTLVESCRTPAEADVVVQQASLAVGAASSAAGVALAAMRRWLLAAGLLLAGLLAFGSGLSRIRR